MPRTRECERCGERLDPERLVQLELNTYTGTYHRAGEVPPDDSQGWFDFGSGCAATVLANGGVNKQIRRRQR